MFIQNLPAPMRARTSDAVMAIAWSLEHGKRFSRSHASSVWGAQRFQKGRGEADVAVINAVQRVQFDGVSFERARQKGGVDPEAWQDTLSLHIIEENRDVRNVFARHAMEEKLVHEDLAQPILAARFDGANHLHQFAGLDDEVVLEAHLEFCNTRYGNWHIDRPLGAIDSRGNEDELNETLE